MSQIALNLARIREKIAEAALRSGRSPGDVTLVGVSKTHPAELVQEAVDAGLRNLGENRIQEARDKRPLVTGEAHWHFIGPLQSKKARYVPGLFDWVETLCRLEEVEALQKRFAAAEMTVQVLVQVNVGGEEQKNGLSAHELFAFLGRLAEFPALQPRGLMTIPPYHAEAEEERIYYQRLRALRDEAQAKGFEWCRELSMGMSHDFEVAIEEGATLVRVGTALFGARS